MEKSSLIIQIAATGVRCAYLEGRNVRGSKIWKDLARVGCELNSGNSYGMSAKLWGYVWDVGWILGVTMGCQLNSGNSHGMLAELWE